MTQDAIARTIRERRTINRFLPEPPPRRVILEGLELACWAPNHHLTEPWHFYLLGPETRAAVVDLNSALIAERKGDAAARQKRARWESMPGWLLVTCDRSSDALREREDYAACCCAIQNLALYLWERGVGMKWSTGAIIREPAFYDAAWIDPELETVVGLFWYGYPDETPDAHRKALAESLVELP